MTDETQMNRCVTDIERIYKLLHTVRDAGDTEVTREMKKKLSGVINQYDEYLQQQTQVNQSPPDTLTLGTLHDARRKLGYYSGYKVTIILPASVTWRDRVMTMHVNRLDDQIEIHLMKPLHAHAYSYEPYDPSSPLTLDESVTALRLIAHRVCGTVYEVYE